MARDFDHDIEMQPKKGVQQLIPAFIREMCKQPQSVELRVSYDAPTQQSTYTYSITWEEDDVDQEKEYRAILERMERMGRSTASDTRAPPIPVLAVCDGPCKKTFPSNLLNTIGRCGHYLCVACFGIVQNSDGTNGCSAAHCNWKGDTRKEAKKHFEKEICEKQRIRAREMKEIGVDVKSASTASSSSSRTNSKKSSPSTTTMKTDSSTLLSSPRSAPSTPSKFHKFHLTYPSKQEIIGVKLFILEEMLINGKAHNVAELEFTSSKLVKNAVTALVVQKFKEIPTDHQGVLYHVELMPNLKRRLNRVRGRDYQVKALFEFSQIAEHIVFVLDFGGFVKDGQCVHIG